MTQPDTLAKLAACPFCGGEAAFDHDDHGWNWIYCTRCDASTNRRASLMEDCKPLLAEAWNRRALSAQALPAAPEPVTRFCPGCGSVGEVEAKYLDCCPDGGRARVVPETLAHHCRDLFKLAIESHQAAQQAAQVPAMIEREAGWFSLVMNAAVCIEDASHSLRDPDAKKSADSAAKHYRNAANAMFNAAALPQAPQPQEDAV